MRKLVLGLICLAVIINTSAAFWTPQTGEDIPREGGGGGGGTEGGASFVHTTHTGGDGAQYSHESTAVQFSGNDTAWTRRTIELDAVIDVAVEGTALVMDGMGVSREAKVVSESLDGTYTLTVEGTDRLKDLVFSGGVSRDLTKYLDIHDGTVVAQAFRATLTVDDIPGIGRLVTSADAEVFPPAGSFASLDLTESVLDTAQDTMLEPDMRGDPLAPLLDGSGTRGGEEQEGLTGEWVITDPGPVDGVPALLLNISVGGGDGMLFTREIWLGEDISLPLRQHTVSVTETEREGGVDYLRMEGSRRMTGGSYSAGGEALTAEGDRAPDRDRHTGGEYAAWGLMPSEGSGFDEDSSLLFSCDDAVSSAVETVPELDGFVDPSAGCMITRAVFNATPDRTDPEGRAGEYTWNLTFSRPGTVSPGEDLTVLVKHNVKRAAISGEYAYNTTAGAEDGITLSATGPDRDGLSGELLTLRSSEELFRRHEAVDEALTGVIGRDDIDGLTHGFHYGGVPASAGDDDGIPLVSDLYLDLDLPSGATIWRMYKEESASKSVSSVIDADSGATLYVITFESGRAALL